MSSQLNEIDRELLGEVSHKDGAEATMAETTGGPGKGGLEDSHRIEFTPLNATAGTLVKVSSNGDELEPGNVSSQSCPSSHFPFLDNIFHRLPQDFRASILCTADNLPWCLCSP